jgi:virginiamycin B lyase
MRRRLTVPGGRRRWAVALVVGGLAAGVLPVSLRAASGASGAGVVWNFTDPGIATPQDITAGPDGALWFTNSNSIGRITTAGAVTTFGDPAIVHPQRITTGADGALWFTNDASFPPCRGSIGRITTAGVVTTFTDPSICAPFGITAGPDGALWFTNCCSPTSSIGRITTAGAVSNFPGAYGVLGDITPGPDGALYYRGTGSIGRVTTSGVITRFVAPHANVPAAGPDGAVWFTRIGPFPDHPDAAIGRLTTADVISYHTGQGIDRPVGIAAGGDGALWFTNVSTSLGDSIGRITTAGIVTKYTDPRIRQPLMITSGSDGALWFINAGNNSIGRISTADSVVTSPTQGPRRTALTITGLGFAAGETVAVTYVTGLSAPTAVLLCNAIAARDGTFSCRGHIPTGRRAGGAGTHTIKANGTSGTKAKTLFLLTRCPPSLPAPAGHPTLRSCP